MPRTARKLSESSIYHIMLRGINKQVIFKDDQDRARLLETIGKYQQQYGYKIYAYCIMDNHIHMLIKETQDSVSNMIKRISSSYVFWYNKKYERCGHLFQERFKSEAVEYDAYFLTVLRYIHQNPVKVGIAKNVEEYPWSGYKEYIEGGSIIDPSFVLDQFSSDRVQATRLFKEYSCQRNNDWCLDYDEETTVLDSEIKELLYQKGIKNPMDLKILSPSKRAELIGDLKRRKGVTITQLSRVTGLSRSTINRL